MKFRNFLIIPVLLMMIVSTGCATQGAASFKAKEINSVSLECIQICLEKENMPFTEKVFEDQESIGLFVEALNHAAQMEGVLDYGALFLMTVDMKGGSSKQYHLNIEDTDSQRGMLVHLPDTEQGYTISEKTSEKLRKLIYKSE